MLDLLIWHIHIVMLYTITQFHAIQILVITLGLIVVVLLNLLANLHVGQYTEDFAR